MLRRGEAPVAGGCRFRLLGAVEMEVDGAVADLGGPRQRAILAVLLLARSRPVEREEIVERVWGPDAPATAAHAVEVYVSKLRRLTDPGARRGAHRVLRSVPGGYVLEVPAEAVDLLRFEELVGATDLAARQGDPEKAAELSAQALALWRGPALAGLRDFPFAAAAEERLRELQGRAAEHRARYLVARPETPGALAEIEAWVAANPVREGLVEQLMLGRRQAGDAPGAMAAYHRARRALAEELGVEPSPRLRALAGEIANDGVTSGSDRRLVTAVPTKLVIGRAAEVESIAALVRRRSVVTITGFPGTGKTTVAAEVGRALEGEFDGEIYAVDLALVRDPRDVPDHMARALGLQDQTVKRTIGVLNTYLADRRLLLILDNCEHVAEALRLSAGDRSRSPGLRLLVTSVVPIGVPDEVVFHLGPLSLPASTAAAEMAASGAVALLRDRLLMVDPDYEPRAGDAEAIFAICHRLDGLPLAIELAAARTSVLSLGQLAALLERDLSLLNVRPGGQQARRSLESALESSHDALSGLEKRILCAAACFTGPIDVELLLEVAGITTAPHHQLLGIVDSLVGRALLARSRSAGEQRLRVLHATREFTLRRARPSLVAACRRRHVEAFAAACERLVLVLEGGSQVPALEWIEEQLDNVRPALRGLLDGGQAPRALAILAGLGRFWWVRGHLTEGRRWLQEALLACPEPTAQRAEALRVLAYLEWSQGAAEAGLARCREALQIAEGLEDARSIARSCHYLGVALHAVGRLDEARAILRRGLAMSRVLGDVALEGLMLDMLARAMIASGQQAQARGAHERALRLLQETGDAFGIAVCLVNVGEARERDREHQPARAAYLEALERFQALNCVVGEGYALQGLAWIAGQQGDRDEAQRLVQLMRECWDRIGYVPSPEDDARNAEISGDLSPVSP